MKDILLHKYFNFGFQAVAYQVDFKQGVNFSIQVNNKQYGLLAVIDNTNYRFIDVSETSRYGINSDVKPGLQSKIIYPAIPELFDSNKLIFLYMQNVKNANDISSINLQCYGNIKYKLLFHIDNNQIFGKHKNVFSKHFDKKNIFLNKCLPYNYNSDNDFIDKKIKLLLNPNANDDETLLMKQMFNELLNKISLDDINLHTDDINYFVSKFTNNYSKIATITNIINVILNTKSLYNDYTKKVMFLKLYNNLETDVPDNLYTFFTSLIN